MQWPALVPSAMCKVPITITLTDGLGEDGAPNLAKSVTTLCNFNGKGGWTVDEQRRMVRYAAAALLPGDPAPELPRLTGWVYVVGQRMTIHSFDRARNPDGTVNYTRLELT